MLTAAYFKGKMEYINHQPQIICNPNATGATNPASTQAPAGFGGLLEFTLG
jgi:hypothetical protein